MSKSSDSDSGLSKEYWESPDGLVSCPWKFATENSKRGPEWKKHVLFYPDRKKGALEGGGTVSVQVFLKGKWHWVRFATDGEAYLKLSKLPHRARALLLESLALVPVRANLLKNAGPKRPRGNSQRDAQFWKNIGYWSPAALVWAETTVLLKPKPAILKRLVKLAKDSGFNCGDKEYIASAICLLAWKAINAINPSRFPLPRGKSLQEAVVGKIASEQPSEGKHSYGPDMGKFVQAIVQPGKNSEAIRRDIIVVSHEDEFGPTDRMSDFRIF